MSRIVRCDRCRQDERQAGAHGWSQLITARDGTHDLCYQCSAAALRWVRAGVTNAELHAGRKV